MDVISAAMCVERLKAAPGDSFHCLTRSQQVLPHVMHSRSFGGNRFVSDAISYFFLDKSKFNLQNIQLEHIGNEILLRCILNAKVSKY